MENIAFIILAAGLGKRLGLDLPKALLKTSENTLVQHVLETALELEPHKIVLVLGHQKELVEKTLLESTNLPSYKTNNLKFVTQPIQKGTGDAVRYALPELSGFTGNIFILYGDVPLIKSSTLKHLLQFHLKEKATLSLLSLCDHASNSYGRLIRDKTGKFVERIVEVKDCSPQDLLVKEFNPGIYLVESSFLAPAIDSLNNNNAQQEYYLTDIIEKASKEGQTVLAFPIDSPEEVQGVNDLSDLAKVNLTLNLRRVQKLLFSGVEIADPSSLFLDKEVSVANGVKIGPSVQLVGKTIVETKVQIEGTCYIKDCSIKEGAHLKFGVRAEGAIIGKQTSVGPFAHLRPGTILEEHAKIGNFVETKNAHIEPHAKANHLSYLGDCRIGENSNIGAGTITCNYDGYRKSETTIGKNVFIGSNSALVAPVVIEDGATIGAGSVITKKVEKDSLALTRAPQECKPGWAKRKKERMGKV